MLAAFVGLALLVYAPALDGSFISDDLHYVQENPYVHDPSRENLIAILNPQSGLAALIENYAPVHMLLHVLEWQLFGREVYGYHVVNVVLHALASLLLALLWIRTGISSGPALLGAGLFLVHPANVEAVAWISQLKSSSALVLSLGALLVQPRRPLVGSVLFALALLAKPTALFALPVALVLQWLRPAAATAARAEGDAARPGPGSAQGLRRDWVWLGAWLAIFLAFAAIELSAFTHTAGQVGSLYDDPLVRLRSSVAIGFRYLVMAASSYGLSTFHEPAPAASWFDPWWMMGLFAFGLMAWRIVVVFRARRIEAAFWIWAAASFAPASGILALPYPMADRYLYFVLPGLIGSVLHAGREVLDRVAPESAAPRDVGRRRRSRAVALTTALAIGLGVFYALRSVDRARVWRSSAHVMADAVLHYPEGTAAQLRAADRAARLGDVDAVVAALRAAHRRGYDRLDQILADPSYASMRDDARFRSLLEEIALGMIQRLERNDSPGQLELHVIAVAYELRGETERAAQALERALEVGGPIDPQVRADLRRLRAKLRREALRDPATSAD